MTPDQYRREGAEAMRKAAADMIEDDCSFMSQHGMAQAILAIDVDEVLAGLSPPAPDAVTRLMEALTQALAANERWQKNSAETWEAMQTMRNAINEHIPMPSTESDLLQGPENSVFCATVAEAVITGIQARAAAAAMDMRERAATHTQWTAWGEHHVLTEAARKAIRALPIDPDALAAMETSHD